MTERFTGPSLDYFQNRLTWANEIAQQLKTKETCKNIYVLVINTVTPLYNPEEDGQQIGWELRFYNEPIFFGKSKRHNTEYIRFEDIANKKPESGDVLVIRQKEDEAICHTSFELITDGFRENDGVKIAEALEEFFRTSVATTS